MNKILFINRLKGFNIQKFVVSVCFFLVCIGSQQIQTVKWDTGIIEFSRDMIGVLMAVILLTHYKWNDFVKYKIPYIYWSMISVVIGVILIPLVISKRPPFLLADTLIIAVGIFLMGYCLIHTIISYCVERQRPRFYRPLMYIWVVMLCWMICSRSDYLWPICYFVIFICYYLTPQTSEQRMNIIKGMLDGIIWGFLAIQAHSLLFRPYDRERYCGNFCNPNHNCVFLCICLVAILNKIIMLTSENKCKHIRLYYFGLAGVCYSFIFMTVSRSGYITTFVVTFFFLLAYCNVVRKRVFLRMGLLMVLLFISLMPITYMAVRYIPTIHPHVLFYYQEGYSESRVHSWDERDSEKFVSFEELINLIFYRFESLKGLQSTSSSNTNIITQEVLLVSNSDYIPKGILRNSVAHNTYVSDKKDEVDIDKKPALTQAEALSALRVRYTIYKWYWDHLSLFGMPYDEQGFQLTETHWIQDTHNIYLDYGINFGWPAMILFTVFIWWGIGRLAKRGFKEGDVKKMVCLLIALVPPVFGLFEFSWGAGMISTVAFYLSFKEMLIKE